MFEELESSQLCWIIFFQRLVLCSWWVLSQQPFLFLILLLFVSETNDVMTACSLPGASVLVHCGLCDNILGFPVQLFLKFAFLHDSLTLRAAGGVLGAAVGSSTGRWGCHTALPWHQPHPSHPLQLWLPPGLEHSHAEHDWSAGLVWGDASISTERGEKHKSIEYKYLTWAFSLSARGCVTPVLPPCRWQLLIHARRGRGAVSAVAASKRSLQAASSSVVTCRQPGTQVSAAVVSNW